MGSIFSKDIVAGDEIIIAVMGMTGSGKSSFIQRATGKNKTVVGHGLQSVTTEMIKTTFRHNGAKYALIDTPGFDDTDLNHDVVVVKILEWLQRNFNRGRVLDGIIYLHSLNNPRMTWSSRASLRVFRKLCGNEALSRVILGTTFWDAVPPMLAEHREKHLRETFWKDMLNKGSSMVRIYYDRDSGLRQIERLAHAALPDGMPLQFQKEVMDEGGELRNTAVFRQALSDVQGSKAGPEQRAQWEKDLKCARLRKKKALKSQDKSFLREAKPLKHELQTLENQAPDIEGELEQERRRLERKYASWREELIYELGEVS